MVLPLGNDIKPEIKSDSKMPISLALIHAAPNTRSGVTIYGHYFRETL
jgi:hypothetical protein